MKNWYKVIGIIMMLVLPAYLIMQNNFKKIDNSTPEEGEFNFLDNPDKIAQYHYLIRNRDIALPGRTYQANYKLSELGKIKELSSHNASRTNALSWVERGPGNVPGRTRGLLVLDGDADKNTWLAGSASGGIWKTTDAGATWENNTPDLPNLSTTVLAKSNSSDAIMYAGTGEFFNNVGGVDGDGIFKSIDAGESWTQLTSTASNSDFRNTFKIIVHPSNPDILLAAVSETSAKIFQADLKCTIYKSIDGGVSWVEKYTTNRRIMDFVFHPSDFNIQYASVFATGVIKSTDAGENWLTAGTEIISTGRIVLAIAPSDATRIYASVQGSISGVIGPANPTGANGSDLYVSVNSGNNWELLLEQNNGINHNFLDGQGEYDNTIVVNPYNENEIYVGGVDLFQMIVSNLGSPIPAVGSVDTTNVGFISFIGFGASFFGGILETGNNNQATNLVNSDFVDVEFRFGTGKSQMAHRYSIQPGSGASGDDGAGVQPNGYLYEDYVEVPFEVWDVTNNKQLMASFRDQEDDGVWDLVERDANDATVGREYFFVNGVEYDPINPDPNMTSNGGHSYKQLYFMWPSLATGFTFDAANMPVASIVIHRSELQTRNRVTLPFSDSRGQYAGVNASNQTFGETNQKDLHPDHHNLVAIPVDDDAKTFKLLNSNDGGVFISNVATAPGINDGDWTFSGKGYNTSQFYGADKKPGKLEFIGGMQDNGSWRSPNAQEATKTSSYTRQVTGDGFEAVWHYGDENQLIGSSQGNNFRKSIDGGRTWASAVAGYSESSSPFVSKLDNSKNNPDVLYTVGSQGVWKSTDFADNWELTPINDNWDDLGFVMDVKTSISNHQILWVGGAMIATSKIHLSTDGGQSFEPVPNFQPENLLGRISGIETHPTEDSTAYVLFSFANGPKLIRTEDMGKTWEELSGFGSGLLSSNGFPNVAVYTLVVMPYDPSVILVGTEIGIIESTDNGANWHLLNSDLPAVSVWELKIVDDELIAATHGRGIWTANIADINKVPFITSYNEIQGLPPVLEVNMRDAYDSVLIYSNDKFITKVISPAVGKTDVEVPIELDGMYKLYAVSYINNVGYKSSSVTLNVVIKEAPVVLSAANFEKDLGSEIYPNPSTSGQLVNFKFNDTAIKGSIDIIIYSLSGKMVSSESVKDSKNISFEAPLKAGVYLVKILQQGKEIKSSKLVVN